ncbi:MULTISPECIES: hypothetical protein [Caproicibacterium]|uniref:Uncharacterized protein n=1 Tax=Caproicibacterium argilliputei TaxID=3030016 RepID=A0AA97H3R1_9FIRM|nr:hypothetical protein [Caproicibacterium argilliputei]WOC33482.1 hypothetical protein PXC00_06340 [Caproicibacterium argilliputei]
MSDEVKTAQDVLDAGVTATGVSPQAVTTESSQEDVLKMLLSAADYKEDTNLQKAITVKRNGTQVLPSFHVRPLSQDEVNIAHKKATKYMSNPGGRRLPKIEVSTDNSIENDWLIYLATTDEDKEKLWNNQTYIKGLQSKFPNVVFSQGSSGPQMINLLLTLGEKVTITNSILDMSYPEDDIDEDAKEVSQTEFAKN